jgi:hypothetical protein
MTKYFDATIDGRGTERYLEIARNPHLVIVAAIRRMFGLIKANIVGLGFRVLHLALLWLGLGIGLG